MRTKLITVILMNVVALLIALPVLAYDEPTELELSMPGIIEGTGTYFEIKDSEYLNISLQSTEEITISLESVPKTISLNIEASSADLSTLTIDNFTTLTIGALEANRTYYKFEDSYKNETVFVSDESGNYSWTQDLSQSHYIWIQEEQSATIYLPDQCSTYGIWDSETSTCTLNQDLTESVGITANDITLDCNGHSIIGSKTGYGTYLNYKSGIVIKNCIIAQFSTAIFLKHSSNNMLLNNTVSNNHIGISLYRYYNNNNTLTNNTVLSNGVGIYLWNASNNTLTGNILSSNDYNFCLKGDSDSHFNNYIDTSNTVDGKPIYYILNATNQVYDSSTNAGTFYCISCNNVTVKDLFLTNNGNGILFWKTKNSRIEDNVISNHHFGIYLGYSDNNTLTNNTALNNPYGVYLFSSGNNILNSNIASNNSVGIVLGFFSDTNSLSNNTVSQNRWYGIELYYYSNDNILISNTISNNDVGIGLYFSNNNEIYHNNFIDNRYQAAVTGIGNLFDNGYPSGGNYWLDYIGVDLYSGLSQDQPGADGIGDTPYTFIVGVTGGEDRYPFMEESGWEIPPIPTYNVAVILAETNDTNHISSSITVQPCKLFPEKTYPNGRSKEYYQDLAYCIADYHKENSFETINLDFEIFDDNGNWFKTDKNEQDYLSKEHEFVIEVIDLAINKGVDLSDRDIVIVLHSGEAAKTKEDIGKKLFTMTWGLISQPLGYPPYKIIVAEDDFVGAWAHEIGHIIGALLTPENTIIPDLAPMGLSAGHLEFIMKRGGWDLMARGSWNDEGNDPPYMSSYTKEFLQWLNYDIHPKSAYGEYWINSLDTSELDDNIFRYNLSEDVNDESPEYYILEARNRNLKTWDSSLPEEKAMVLYRVDTHNFPEYGYDEEGWMWNKNRSIVIPGGIREYFINDGVLSPTGETYRDFDNLVKFIALTDRTTDDKYEIQTKIEEITYDSFGDIFWGIILKPSSLFRQKIKRIFPLNPVKTLEFHKNDNNSKMLLATLCVYDPQTGEYECSWTPKPLTGKEAIQHIILTYLIPILLLILLLVLLNRKIVPRWKSERKRKIAKIFIKIFLVTSIIAFIGFFLFAVAFIIFASEETTDNLDINNSREIATPSLLPLTFPDLDLHLYCEDGRHIGMDYETGEYEIQIEGAIVSGDNRDAPEWIFIPPDITNCRFVVSSYDNKKFLEENPEIAQEIEDTTDSYDVYARYIDPEADIYTSTIISEDIKPGIELEHQISGTHDIAIGPGILLARVDFNPDTLNLKNKGKWVTVYIELPKDYDPNLIDLNTVLLNGQIPAENNPKYEFVTDPNSYLVDIDNNDILERMVKFDQSALQDILEIGEEVEIVITGEVIGGRLFQGSDIIKVVSKGKWKNILTLGFLACFMVGGLLIHRRRVRKRNGVLNKKSK